jgi:hypothetical protein
MAIYGGGVDVCGTPSKALVSNLCTKNNFSEIGKFFSVLRPYIYTKDISGID